MRIGIVVQLVLFFTSSLYGQKTAVELRLQELATKKLTEAILSHPDHLVREKLYNWIKAEKVLFAGNNIFPEMNSSQEENSAKKQVYLWYNIPYLFQMSDVQSQIDKKSLLWLVLYHEAVHIDDHFSGKLPLGPVFPTKIQSDTEIANDIWNKEWSAVTKEWTLAKKMQKPYLVPVIYEAVKKRENPKTFLRGFYQLQVSGNAIKFNPKLLVGISARYKQELNKVIMFLD